MTASASTGIRITSNRAPRDIVDAWELTPAEREEFDYLDWPAIEGGRDSASFVRYHGELYDLGDGFVSAPEVIRAQGWDLYQPDGFFSGLVLNYTDDGEQVVVGRYTS